MLIVAKRLAQCLNPALPTGVHQWALDLYVHIMSVLGVSYCSNSHPLYLFICSDGRVEERSLTLVFRLVSFLPGRSSASYIITVQRP